MSFGWPGWVYVHARMVDGMEACSTVLAAMMGSS